MLRFRRTSEQPRVEIVPLIDVVFLVLTFFIYAMVLMIPAKVLPMRLQALSGGEHGEPAPAVTISITKDGEIAVDREPVPLEGVLDAVRAATEENPDAIIYIAAEEGGEIDRLPIFIEVYGRLMDAGLDIRLVGRPPVGGSE